MTETSGWMMVDGKLNPNALRALYAPGMADEVISVLRGTAYEPLVGSGPLLARIQAGGELLERWNANEPPLRFAWHFTSELPPYALAAYWQRRLLVQGPLNRTLWLRYADSRVVARGIERNILPTAFWGSIESLRLSPQQGAWKPLSLSDHQTWEEPDGEGLLATFTFNERQLAALSPTEDIL